MGSRLPERIKSRDVQVSIVGLGYVGLPLAMEIAKAGFRVVGYDTDRSKIDRVNAGHSYISDVPEPQLAKVVKGGLLSASADPDVLRAADVVILCVPTPLNKTKDPDNSFILAALDALAPRLKKDALVILESTTFPGFTREILVPRLAEDGRIVGKDVYVAFSPERVDPGNKTYGILNTPKVIGGVTAECCAVATAMYREVMAEVVPVSSTDAAEMVKLLENTFRAVNIGLVNEVALMCHRLKLDTWEVIDAAATKPFGFMPFYPGPGLGGHCIPVDPHYLSWKLKTLKYNARFIELAGQVNSGMPAVVADLVADALNDRERSVKGSRILIVGVAYKRDISDVRESPALDIIELLEDRGAKIFFHDPHVASIDLGGRTRASVGLDDLKSYDAVVVVTAHSGIDYAEVVKNSRLVIDTRNTTKGLRDDTDAKGKVVTL